MYNNASADWKWKKWKEREEKVLRENGFPEEKIKELYDYDRKDFNSDRRFKQRNVECEEPDKYASKIIIELPIRDYQDLLDQIDDDYLYQVLSQAHMQTCMILFLKIYGFKNREISTILGLSESAIRKRLYIIRKKLKK